MQKEYKKENIHSFISVFAIFLTVITIAMQKEQCIPRINPIIKEIFSFYETKVITPWQTELNEYAQNIMKISLNDNDVVRFVSNKIFDDPQYILMHPHFYNAYFGFCIISSFSLIISFFRVYQGFTITDLKDIVSLIKEFISNLPISIYYTLIAFFIINLVFYFIFFISPIIPLIPIGFFLYVICFSISILYFLLIITLLRLFIEIPWFVIKYTVNLRRNKEINISNINMLTILNFFVLEPYSWYMKDFIDSFREDFDKEGRKKFLFELLRIKDLVIIQYVYVGLCITGLCTYWIVYQSLQAPS